MSDAISLVRDWMVQFLKSRDAFFRKIAEMKPEEGSIMVKYKDGKEQKVLIAPDFRQAGSLINGFKEDSHIAIVTLSNKKNKEALVSQWKTFIPYKFLTVYFVNPRSSQEKKWVLMPHVHHKVCDDKSLMQGFVSLSEMVEDISEEQLRTKS